MKKSVKLRKLKRKPIEKLYVIWLLVENNKTWAKAILRIAQIIKYVKVDESQVSHCQKKKLQTWKRKRPE